MPDPHFSDLILPQNEQLSMSQLMASLKRTTLTIHNRLTSIQTDAEFVDNVSHSYAPRPLVANERCGSWYIPPERKGASAYFKIEIIEKNDGIIIVDSTRRGKRMPDALSSTIPIWCTVLNLAIIPSHPSSSKLYLPSHLPATTHSQISTLIPGFVASLKALNLNLPTCLTKPLRPFWVTPDSTLPSPEDTESIFEDFRPVICCTASRRVVGSEMDEGGYIQGAGDDTEMWAHGLEAPLFWENVDELLETSEAELPDLISRIVDEQATSKKDEGFQLQIVPHISVCALPLPAMPAECRIAITQDTTPKDSWLKSKTYMQAGLGKSKLASRNLRTALPEICDFAAKYLASVEEPGEQRIAVACESGKDLSVGVALAISCYLFGDEGKSSGELGPVTHDDHSTSIAQDLFHLGLLVLSIRTDVANDLDSSTGTAESTALAVLNGNCLLGLLAELLKSMEVDGGVRLAGRLLETCGSREDNVAREVLVLADLLDGSANSKLLELLIDTNARLEGLLELGDDGVFLLSDVGFEVFGGNVDVVVLLEGGEHATEVLANELLDESLASESHVNLARLADLVDETSASLKGKLLREDEGVVAVEQEGVDLESHVS
ncbi:hypothetical protein HG531_003523 [Fusarium graminearum]|nr:hypothetical protein HG531_003523 [Fusarium graminearum]